MVKHDKAIFSSFTHEIKGSTSKKINNSWQAQTEENQPSAKADT